MNVLSRRAGAGLIARRAMVCLLLTMPWGGCGSPPRQRPDRVVVTGTVMCGAEPLAGGSIVLYSATSTAFGTGMIAEDGGFRCLDVPPGPVICVIENDSLKPYAIGRTLQRVNPAATSKETSPLKADVIVGGTNVLVLDVMPPPE